MSLTKTEVNNLRIERVLPYINNASGISLDELLIIIDNKLKESSPDSLSPGLINWNNKHLFTEKFIKTSGL